MVRHNPENIVGSGGRGVYTDRHDVTVRLHTGPMILQRLNTVGGKAPADLGDFPGQEARVPYTAADSTSSQ